MTAAVLGFTYDAEAYALLDTEAASRQKRYRPAEKPQHIAVKNVGGVNPPEHRPPEKFARTRVSRAHHRERAEVKASEVQGGGSRRLKH